jgi:hypothetical protein
MSSMAPAANKASECVVRLLGGIQTSKRRSSLFGSEDKAMDSCVSAKPNISIATGNLRRVSNSDVEQPRAGQVHRSDMSRCEEPGLTGSWGWRQMSDWPTTGTPRGCGLTQDRSDGPLPLLSTLGWEIHDEILALHMRADRLKQRPCKYERIMM